MASDELIDFEQLENRYYAPIKGFKLIMQKLIYELRSYDGACAPFVENILEFAGIDPEEPDDELTEKEEPEDKKRKQPAQGKVD